MDIIDKLRSTGISKYIDLPQIVVCGDQNSGKSSVLQAISGMSFPVKDGLGTRFATELILRHVPEPEGSKETVHISIQPANNASPEHRKRLQDFQQEFSEIPDQSNIGAIIEKAKDVMGIDDQDPRSKFSNDVLRIKLSGHRQPHLTIVDLPGLFRAGSKEQSSANIEKVRSLVLS
jgi:GTPase SAR1 family protein